ncbi:MAG TPA: YkvA family protein [Rubrivivax sp.]
MKPWKRWVRLAGAGGLSTRVLALWKLFRHPQTPRIAKFVALLVVAYALSPIDLIPDFIPVLGLLDDLVIVPLGIALVVKLSPTPLWDSCLREAQAGRGQLPRLLWGAALVLVLWLMLLAALGVGVVLLSSA